MSRANDNWVYEENLKEFKNKACKLSHDRKNYELKKIADGYKKIYVDHPELPRTKIEKWIR